MIMRFEFGDIRRHDGQIYHCIQPHEVHPGQEETHAPDVFRAGWGIYHGSTIETARPWIAPLGTSGIYMKGHMAIWTDGYVYRSNRDNNAHSPGDLPEAWDRVTGLPDEPGCEPIEHPIWEPIIPGINEPHSMGDIVWHNGILWVSDIYGNVWEPGSWGWTQLT